jgi:hypothetical protein
VVHSVVPPVATQRVLLEARAPVALARRKPPLELNIARQAPACGRTDRALQPRGRTDPSLQTRGRQTVRCRPTERQTVHCRPADGQTVRCRPADGQREFRV